MQARDLARRHRRRCVAQTSRVEPATLDPVPVRAQDIGVEPVADDDDVVPGDRAREVGGIGEETCIGLGVATGLRRGDKRDVGLQSGTGDAARLDAVDAVRDDAHFTDCSEGLANLQRAIDQHDRLRQGCHIQVAGALGVERKAIVDEGLAEPLHLEEVLGDGAGFEAAPEVQVDRLVPGEQAGQVAGHAQRCHGACKGELFGRPEVEQRIVQVEQEQCVFHVS